MSRGFSTRFDGFTAELFIPGRPPLLNAERAGHWTKQSASTKAYRQIGQYAGAQLMRQGWEPVAGSQVTSWPSYPNRRSWPDIAAWFPAVKAVVDGLVDAGAWEDDTVKNVRKMEFLRPELVKPSKDPQPLTKVLGPDNRDTGLTVQIRPCEG